MTTIDARHIAEGLARPRNIEDTLAKLTGVKKVGDHWEADCPAPGHKTPQGHLSIKDVPRMALAHCHPDGGHSYQDICAALGFESLTYANDGSQPGPAPFPKLTDTEAMALLKQSYGVTEATIRHFGIKADYECWKYPVNGGHRYKKYSRQSPRKYWHDPGTPNQLYGLSDIPEGTKEVWLVNGEPGVWVSYQAGIPAVCGIYGEGQLPENAVQELKGNGVQAINIVPDLDAPGRKAAVKEYEALKASFTVRVRQLPDHLGEKADVCDLFLRYRGDAGGFEKGLVELPEVGPATLEKETGRAPAKDRPGDVRLVRLADVPPETVDWLWPPYIPLGKLTLLEGDPGVGKSWLSLSIATAISLGRGLPGTEPAAPGQVLLASAEDGLGDTIRPRLDRLGADSGNIHAIDGPLDFSNGGLEILRTFMESVQPHLVIIDPLVAYIGASVDIHRANETRAIMAALADIAAKGHAAMLAVRHLTKGGMTKAIYRGIGSIDFTAACRSVLLAGCDPEDPQKRGLVHIKSNLAAMGLALGYELREDRFYWKEGCDLTAARILAAEDGEGQSARDEAKEFLEDDLSDGAVDAAQVFKDAKALNLAPATLNRAKTALGIITHRLGEPGKKGGGKWTWELPPKDNPAGGLEDQKDLGYQDVHTEKLITLIENRYKDSPAGKPVDNLNPPSDQAGRQPEAAAWKL